MGDEDSGEDVDDDVDSCSWPFGQVNEVVVEMEENDDDGDEEIGDERWMVFIWETGVKHL